MWQHAIELAQQAGNREKAAIYQAAAAVCEAHFGNRAAATERARAALELGKGRDVRVCRGVCAGALRRRFRHRKVLPTIWRNDSRRIRRCNSSIFPRCARFSRLSGRRHWTRSSRLHTALPYDLAMPGTAFFAKFGGLYPVYVRGQAYLEAGRGREAAAEFQKVLDHRGIVLADPIGALAHLQLGRAFVLREKRTGPGAPTRSSSLSGRMRTRTCRSSQQARAEYAKL